MYSSVAHRRNGRPRRPEPSHSPNPVSIPKFVPQAITNILVNTNNEDKHNVATVDDVNTTTTHNDENQIDLLNTEVTDVLNAQAIEEIYIHTEEIHSNIEDVQEQDTNTFDKCNTDFTPLHNENVQSDLSCAESLSLVTDYEVGVFNVQRCNEKICNNETYQKMYNKCESQDESTILPLQTKHILFNNFTITIPTELC